MCLCVCLPRTCSTIYLFFFLYSGLTTTKWIVCFVRCLLSAKCMATITIIHTNDFVNRAIKRKLERKEKNGQRIRCAVVGLVHNFASNCNKSFAEIGRVFCHFELSTSILALTSLCFYSSIHGNDIPITAIPTPLHLSFCVRLSW